MDDPAATFGALWPYLALLAFGFLPSEIWRVLGVFLARGMRQDSEILAWVRSVATALLAGVVAKLLASPSGALAAAPLWGRFGALAIGLAGFFLLRRSVIAGVVLGEAALVGLAWWMAP